MADLHFNSTKFMGYTENNKFKSAYHVICDLIDIVSKNGVMLLNVGPKPDGTITDEETAVLNEIGDWLKTNGEGIYDTVPWKTSAKEKSIQRTGPLRIIRQKSIPKRIFVYI